MSIERIRRIHNPANMSNNFNSAGVPIFTPQQPINIPTVNKNTIIDNTELYTGECIMDPIIISYYADYNATKYYENFANALIRRCQRFKLRFDITEGKSRGSYGSNCLMKPEFILDKLIELKEPIIWMDCDTDFKEPFIDFNNILEDIGMATHTGDMTGIKASPLYFNYSKGAFLIIREWVIHCRAAYNKNVVELDHDALKHRILPFLDKKYTCHLLINNWNDFVTGRYIHNGNSVVDGKKFYHIGIKKITDDIRASYTSDVKTINIFMSDNTKKSFEDAYLILSKFSSFSRIKFIFKKNLKTSKDPMFYKLDIESGGAIDFNKSYEEYKDSNDIYIKISNIKNLEKNWDEKLIEYIGKEINPVSIFNNSSVEIKYNNNIWN